MKGLTFMVSYRLTHYLGQVTVHFLLHSCPHLVAGGLKRRMVLSVWIGGYYVSL